MEPTRIHLEVALRASDVIRARLELFLRRLGLACLTWCALAAAGIYFLPVGTAGHNPVAVIAVIFGPPLLLLLIIMGNAGRQFQAAPSIEPMHYCFHDDGIDIGSSKKAGWIPWEAFQDAVETPSAFLIFLEADQHYLIPKRFLTNPADINALRQLMAAVTKKSA